MFFAYGNWSSKGRDVKIFWNNVDAFIIKLTYEKTNNEPILPEKKILTNSMARKMEKRRLRRKIKKEKERRKNKAVKMMDDLVLRLNYLGSPSLTRDRTKIVASLRKHNNGLQQKLGKFRRRDHLWKVLRWLSKELYRLTPIEKEPSVIVYLLRLIRVVDHISPWRLPLFDESSIYEFAMRLLAQNQCIEARCEIIHMLHMQQTFYERERHEDLTRICCQSIENFVARGSKLTHNAENHCSSYRRSYLWEDCEVFRCFDLLWNIIVGDDQRLVIPGIVRNDAVMSTALNSMILGARVHYKCNDAANSFLGFLLGRTIEADRLFLIDRYHDELQTIFQTSTSWIRENALRSNEFCRMIAEDDIAIDKMMMEHEEKKDDSEEFEYSLNAMLLLVDYSLTNDLPMLQKLLVRGFLIVAQHYAELDIGGDSGETAIFQRLLRVFPAWKQRFRQLTANGNVFRSTTQFGQSIPVRITKSNTYIMEDEVDQF